jgi:hypothetical protein
MVDWSRALCYLYEEHGTWRETANALSTEVTGVWLSRIARSEDHAPSTCLKRAIRTAARDAGMGDQDEIPAMIHDLRDALGGLYAVHEATGVPAPALSMAARKEGPLDAKHEAKLRATYRKASQQKIVGFLALSQGHQLIDSLREGGVTLTADQREKLDRTEKRLDELKGLLDTELIRSLLDALDDRDE